MVTATMILKDAYSLEESYDQPRQHIKIWNKAQAGIKVAGRNINNLRYVDDTTLMAESKEELKSLLIKVKGRVKKLA